MATSTVTGTIAAVVKITSISITLLDSGCEDELSANRIRGVGVGVVVGPPGVGVTVGEGDTVGVGDEVGDGSTDGEGDGDSVGAGAASSARAGDTTYGKMETKSPPKTTTDLSLLIRTISSWN